MFGNNTSHILFVLFFIMLLSYSCGSSKTSINNYITGTRYFNDSLSISANLLGDIDYMDLTKHEFKIKNIDIKNIIYKDLILYGKASDPAYDVFLFSKKNEQTPKTEKELLFINDTVSNFVVYKKFNKRLSLYVCLKAIDKIKNSTLLNDGKYITNSIQFNTKAADEINYFDILNTYKSEDNLLFVYNKIKQAPIVEDEQNKFIKFQVLVALLSKISKNEEYQEMIEKYEQKKKKYLKEKLDVLIKIKGVNDNSVYNKIKKISKNKKVVMLNEMHWKPNHRLVAQKLLKPLKENGFNYFAVEGVSIEKDSILNVRKYPIKSTGYYISEPYFGHLLREALNLGYIIVGYDDFESKNREKAQAENIKKIFDNDSTAKVFVYAGIDHILEKKSSKKWMAEYFKEISNIDPLTIDQVELASDLNKLTLLESKHLDSIKKVNINVDYFLINNISPSFEEIMNPENIRVYQLQLDKIAANLEGKEIFITVYYATEYEKFKSNAVPILNRIDVVTKKRLFFKLPLGEFIVKIQDKGNNLILTEKIFVD